MSKHKLSLLLIDSSIILFSIGLTNYLVFLTDKTIVQNTSILYIIFIYLIYSTTIILLFKINNLYKYQLLLNTSRQIVIILKVLSIGMLIFLFMSFVMKVPEIISNRYLFLILFFTTSSFLIIIRVFIIPEFFYWLVRTKRIQKKIIIVGAGKYSLNHVLSLKNNRKSYFTIFGFLDDDDTKQNKFFHGIPVLGKISEVKEVVKQYSINEIIIIINNIDFTRLQGIIRICKEAGKSIHIISSLYNVVTEKLEVEEFAGISTFKLTNGNKNNDYLLIKRILDILLSSFLLILLLPIFLITAFLIKITSKGPVFYTSYVIGKNEKKFLWYKFRTMQKNSDQSIHKKHIKEIITNGKPGKKIVDDPRITLLGKFLRKHSLDELPQLFCVLKGDMSLIGPRPKAEYEYALMSDWQKQRFVVVPGISGLWQIKGRNTVRFNDEIILDLYYIDNCSLLTDLELLLNTIPVVVFGKGGK